MADYILFGGIAIVCIVLFAIIVADWQTYRAMQEYIECINHMEECYQRILLSIIKADRREVTDVPKEVNRRADNGA